LNKTVLVTGASRGIGRAIALAFAKREFNVVIVARNMERLELLKKEILDLGVDCLSFSVDVGNYDAVTAMFQDIENHFKTLDILVNNAGISKIGLLQDMNVEEWNEIIQTNLSSVFHCSKHAIPLMLSNGQGKIINISSVWGVCGASCEVAYSATKGGINAFTKALGKELAPSNIQVNAIACGCIDTEMNQFLEEEERAYLIEEIPANRMAKPEEVADFVFNLANGNDYLTAQVIQFDGGWI